MSVFFPSPVVQDSADRGWWPMWGNHTPSGIAVDENAAMRLSAVFAATRVISETIASLPLHLMEQVGERTSRMALDHPLYPLLNRAPNSEQDSMTWFDQQIPNQVNQGTAFAEIQRRRGRGGSVGEVVGLWPIHPSRIPPQNIRRNGQSYKQIQVGDPGEIVFYVKNDDGTEYPVRRQNMLCVPGVLTQNGITGRSVIEWGAHAMGVALATERHVAAYFRNGTVSNIAMKSPRKLNEETANRLRNQWQNVYGGADNKFKALVLEDGMEIQQLSIDARQAQLLESRNFSVSDIARWYRLPPHLLADLSRSTFSNIEAENLSFVIHSMMPWIVRWERALNNQLLTPEEQDQYYFRFEVKSLLRGDMAARSDFYTKLFNLGAMSPNDIRNEEDLNPIDDGDVYLVPLNMTTVENAGKVQESAPMPTESDENDDETGQIVPSDARNTLVLATKEAVCAAFQGLVDYEKRHTRNAAKQPGKFMSLVEKVWGRVEDKATIELARFHGTFAALGLRIDTKLAVSEYIQQSKAAIEPLFDCSVNELEPELDAVLCQWDRRAMQFAERLTNAI